MTALTGDSFCARPTLSVQLFHGVLKRLHVLNPRVQIMSLSRRRSGRGSPASSDVSENGSRPGRRELQY